MFNETGGKCDKGVLRQLPNKKGDDHGCFLIIAFGLCFVNYFLNRVARVISVSLTESKAPEDQYAHAVEGSV